MKWYSIFFYNSCFDFTIIEWCSLSTLIVDITKTYQYFMWTNKTVMTVNSFRAASLISLIPFSEKWLYQRKYPFNLFHIID